MRGRPGDSGDPGSPAGRAGDILLEPPLVRHADVVPAVEDRSYVLFIAGALLSALLGGFALAVVVSLAQSGALFEERGPWLVQAHGWAQLQGWAGLFVAGMGVRLLPRFAGRRPIGRAVNVVLFALLFSGVVVRTVAQSLAGDGISSGAFLVGELLWAAGAVLFAGLVAVTLRGGRGGRAPWRMFAFAGSAWWLVWAVQVVAAGIDAARSDAYVPARFDDAMTWTVMLGAAGNFIWAVQSRSVPIFFGRRTPSFGRVAVPGVLLQAGLALIFVAGWLDVGESAALIEGAGLFCAGFALAWLAPVAGACWGKAHRLRPRARGAAEFVRFANIAAVVCGLLLAWAGARTALAGELSAPGLRDAARHAFGAGTITLLIVGMAQLVAPFFALQRVEARTVWLLDRGVLWILVAAAALRVTAGLMLDHISTDTRMHLSAAAGSLAWAGLVLFAVMVAGALRGEPGTKAALAEAARKPGA